MATGLKTGGRKKGSLNKVTAKFKDAVQIVYDEIGGHEAFAQWAKENPSDFYRICSKLIPAETQQRSDVPFGAGGINIIISDVKAPNWVERVDADAALLSR